MNATRQLLKPRLFYAYLPDTVGPNVLATRFKARPAHLKRAEEDKKSGKLEFGRGFLPPPSHPLYNDPALPVGAQPMAGSIMFFRMESLEEVWERLKSDVYWTEGIWNGEKAQVGEFVKMPGDDL
ncbi:hypothetical protein IAR50_003061 [Cryptococcus sp. DSM 104548]